jgi:hypothetical protein
MSDKLFIQGQMVDTKEDDGEGLQFYRCCLCGGVVNKWDIKESHGCPKCAHAKIRPTNLSLWEKIIQVCKHPKVWEW